jgi:competence protein ComEA
MLLFAGPRTAYRAPSGSPDRPFSPPTDVTFPMFDTTPQERLALTVLALLLMGGALARHVVARAEAADVQIALATPDTTSGGSAGALRGRVEQEVQLHRVRTTPLRPGERIDPNLAPAEQLARLPRIGPALAGRIVADREANGPFRTAEDLRRVPGIGPALLQGILPLLDLSSAPAGPVGPAVTASGAGAGPRVDVNRASAADLESLPGIGPALARRIVEHREAHGPFRSVDDLDRVSGIGPRLLERIRGSVSTGY